MSELNMVEALNQALKEEMERDERVVVMGEDVGVDVEVIDLRTLLPLDIDTVITSVQKTGRVVVAHEAPKTCGFGAEIAALIYIPSPERVLWG